MVQTFPPGNVEAQIQGEISGQVAVGNYNIQIGAIREEGRRPGTGGGTEGGGHR